MSHPYAAGIEAIQWRVIVKQDPCSYCGNNGGTVDHIVPVHRGGLGVADNFAGSCRACNGSKGNLSLIQFLLKIRPKSSM